MKISGKTIVITGAGSGLGAALAKQSFEAGANVVLAGRRMTKLQEVMQAIGTDQGRMLGVQTDLSDRDRAGLQRLVEQTVTRFGGIDILINNAFAPFGGELADTTPDEIEYAIRVNLLAPIWLTQLALPHLRTKPESMLVNVASLAALVGLPYQTIYNASKFGLNGFSQALRRELLGTSTRVLTVYPGSIDSEVNTAAMRQRVNDAGVKFDSWDPQRAASVILDGIRRDATELIVASAMEKMMPRINGWFPGLVDRMVSKMGPALKGFMREGNEWARARRSAEQEGARAGEPPAPLNPALTAASEPSQAAASLAKN